MTLASRRAALVSAIIVSLVLPGCAARWAHRKGQSEARKGNWDAAVARLTQAVEKDPDNIRYRMALDSARMQASRFHHEEAKKRAAAEDLEGAVDEARIAAKFAPGNRIVADTLRSIEERIRTRETEKRRLSEYEEMKKRARESRVPTPQLSPRSPVPIAMKFTNVKPSKVLDTLGQVVGVNIIYDPDLTFPKDVSVNLVGVTFEEALDQITLTNRLFYKVVDRNTILIAQESPAKRTQLDDLVLRTFYLENMDEKQVTALQGQIRSLPPGMIQKVYANPELSALTILASPDKMAVVERIIANNDKPRGEVVVQVEIVEVNRSRLKQYGIALSNYQVDSTFSPTGAADEGKGGFTQLRAHFLSSLNLSDFVVNIPSTVLARFLQTDATVRLLASPRIRAFEGKEALLKIAQKVPIPTTSFGAAAPGTVGGLQQFTSFNYQDVGVTLKLTPKVSARGDINLEVDAEFSLLGEDRDVGGGQRVPVILTRNLKGIMRVRDGESSLIGGLLQGRDAATRSGLAGLPSLPIVGKLFSSNSKTKDETEIVISLTPYLVRGPQIMPEDLTPLLVGTDQVARVRGSRPLLAGEEEATPTPPPATPSPAPVPQAVPGTPAPAAPAPPSPPAAPAQPPGGVPGQPVVTDPEDTGATFVPIETNVKAGGTGVLSIVVTRAPNVIGVDLVVSYDPAVVEVQDVGAGALLTLDGVAVGVERNVEAGRVRARLTRASATSGGSGAVASITFKALRPGTSPVAVDSLSLVTPGGRDSVSLPSPGRVVVSP